MDVTLANVFVTSMLIGLIVLVGGSMIRGPRDLLLIFLLVFMQFYGLRPLLFVLGLDTPSPDEQFEVAAEAGLLTTTVLGVSLFLAAALLAFAAIRGSGVHGWGPFVRTRQVELKRALRVTLVATAVATVISAVLLARYGGVAGMVSAAKVDKALAGMFVLRVFPSVGAVLAIGTYLECRLRGASRTWSMVALGCGLLNASYVFLWGSRSLLVVIVATLVLGLRRRGVSAGRWRPGRAIRWQVLLRLTAATIVVIALAGGLRMARDTLINGEVQEVYAEASLARQVSLGMNATYFDAAMLSFRDWPRDYALRNGEDFKTGVLGVVPRALWEDKPDAIAPGKWFRQVYEPEKVNGWPMGAAALWYLNFGWIGIALGGLLTGGLLGVLGAAQVRAPDNGFNTAVAVALGVYVLGLGVDSDTVVRSVLWLVPLLLAARYVENRTGDEPDTRGQDQRPDGQGSPVWHNRDPLRSVGAAAPSL